MCIRDRYEIEPADLKSIAATFASVFPHATMWLVGDGDLLLIGSTDREIERQVAHLPERLRAGSTPQLLEYMGIPPASAPFVVASLFAGGGAAIADYAAGAVLQTDDRTSLEFSAARAMYERLPTANAEEIRSLAAKHPPPAAIAHWTRQASAADWTERGGAALRAEAFEMARASFVRAINLDPHSSKALRGLSETCLLYTSPSPRDS